MLIKYSLKQIWLSALNDIQYKQKARRGWKNMRVKVA